MNPIPEQLRNDIEHIIPTLEGWCSSEKALNLARLIIAHDLRTCVEVGIFGGRSLIAMALAHTHLGRGTSWGCDPWSSEAALEGVNSAGNDAWWAEIDLEKIYRGFMQAVMTQGLTRQCRWVREKGEVFARLFEPDSLGLVHIDGNHSEEKSVQDVTLWLPRVIPGGFVVLDDVDWPTTERARQMLMQSCDEVEHHQSYAVYRKRWTQADRAGGATGTTVLADATLGTLRIADLNAGAVHEPLCITTASAMQATPVEGACGGRGVRIQVHGEPGVPVVVSICKTFRWPTPLALPSHALIAFALVSLTDSTASATTVTMQAGGVSTSIPELQLPNGQRLLWAFSDTDTLEELTIALRCELSGSDAIRAVTIECVGVTNNLGEVLHTLLNLPKTTAAQQEVLADYRRKQQVLTRRYRLAGSQRVVTPYRHQWPESLSPGADENVSVAIGNINALAWYGLNQPAKLRNAFAEPIYFAKPLVLPGDVVFDCGAHTGVVTAHLASIVGPKGRVLAFDPFEQNNDLIECTAALNGLTNIIVTRAGCGHERATLTLSNSSQQTSIGASSHPFNDSIQVRIVPLDDYDAYAPGFVKIDIEGAEIDALKGAAGIFSRRPRVHLEIHVWAFASFGYTLRDLWDIVEQRLPGYSMLVNDDAHPGLMPYARQEITASGTLVAVPQEYLVS